MLSHVTTLLTFCACSYDNKQSKLSGMIQLDTEVLRDCFPRLALFFAAGRWFWRQILLDIDMWEDGTDRVLYPWRMWRVPHCGQAKRWVTLLVPLLDILKVMYIKA